MSKQGTITEQETITRIVVGIILIGRNEGDRLKNAIQSIPLPYRANSVYVDSSSTDGSQELARRYGLEVIELDSSIPFTAARARNAGADYLRRKIPSLEFIQFIDGDCTLAENWLTKATQFLCKHKDIALICGRRREMFPDNSVYNKLCDI